MSMNWSQVQNVPNSNLHQVFRLCRHEFIAMSYPNKRSGFDAPGIFKFNTMRNKWTKIMEYPDDYQTIYHTSTMDIKNNIIYSSNADNKLIKFDLNTKQCIKWGFLNRQNQIHHDILFFKNKFHYFTEKEHSLLDGPSVIRLFKSNSGRSLLWPSVKVIGNEMTTALRRWDNKVVQIVFNEFDNRWDTLLIPIPNDLFATNIIQTTKGDYLLYIGGFNMDTQQRHNSICFWDTKRKKLNKSKINLPPSLTLELSTFLLDEPILKGLVMPAIITRNKINDILLIDGFVRECYKHESFKNLTKLPIYMIDYILKWMCFETLHIIFRTRHWTIDVDKILNSTNAQ